jgi:hypothetical protein
MKLKINTNLAKTIQKKEIDSSHIRAILITIYIMIMAKRGK